MIERSDGMYPKINIQETYWPGFLKSIGMNPRAAPPPPVGGEGGIKHTFQIVHYQICFLNKEENIISIRRTGKL